MTSELILLFLYLGVIALRNAIDDPRRADRACAVLSLVGAVNVPIIYFSVQVVEHAAPGLVGQPDRGAEDGDDMLTGMLIMTLAAWFVLRSPSRWPACAAIILERERGAALGRVADRAAGGDDERILRDGRLRASTSGASYGVDRASRSSSKSSRCACAGGMPSTPRGWRRMPAPRAPRRARRPTYGATDEATPSPLRLDRRSASPRLGIAVALVLNAFQVEPRVLLHAVAGRRPRGAAGSRPFRIGGLVETGSLTRDPDSLTVHFIVTDTAKTIPVVYTGLLPDLFKEGKGVVAQGRLGTRRRVPRDRGAGQARRELHAARGRTPRSSRRRRGPESMPSLPRSASEVNAMIPELGHFALILALLRRDRAGRAADHRRARRDSRADGARAARGARAVPARRARLRLPRLELRHQRLLGR